MRVSQILATLLSSIRQITLLCFINKALKATVAQRADTVHPPVGCDLFFILEASGSSVSPKVLLNIKNNGWSCDFTFCLQQLSPECLFPQIKYLDGEMVSLDSER